MQHIRQIIFDYLYGLVYIQISTNYLLIHVYIYKSKFGHPRPGVFFILYFFFFCFIFFVNKNWAEHSNYKKIGL